MNSSVELFQQVATWLLQNRSTFLKSTASEVGLASSSQYPKQQQSPAEVVSRNPWTNLSQSEKDDYLMQYLGPRQTPLALSMSLSLFYSLLFLVGFLGNILTALIIIFNSYMRVPPNFFLLSLAFADLITLSGGTINNNKLPLGII